MKECACTYHACGSNEKTAFLHHDSPLRYTTAIRLYSDLQYIFGEEVTAKKHCKVTLKEFICIMMQQMSGDM